MSESPKLTPPSGTRLDLVEATRPSASGESVTAQLLLRAIDEVGAKVDRVERGTQAFGTTLTGFDARLSKVESDIATLKTDRDADRREANDNIDAQTKEREAVIGHVRTLELSIGTTRNEVTETKDELKKTNEAVGAIVEQLGISGNVELGANPEPGEKPPVPALEKIDHTNTRVEERLRRSTFIQLLIAMGFIAQLISQHWPASHATTRPEPEPPAPYNAR